MEPSGGRRWLQRAAGVVLSGACLFAPGAARANFPFPPVFRTGAPLQGGGSELTCSEAACHCDSFPCPPPASSAANFSVSIDPPAYTPGSLHQVTVAIARTGQQRWGFELQALDAALARAGSFATGPDSGVTEFFGRQYVHHVNACTVPPGGTCLDPVPPQCEEPAIPDGTTWTFEWAAPASDVGTVTFYAVGNAANGIPPPPCDASFGDFIYGATALVPVPEPGPVKAALAGLAAALMVGRARRRSPGG